MQNFIINKIREYAIDNTRIAIKYEDKWITYHELDRVTDCIAMKIQEKIRGKENCPIIVYQKRGLEFIEYIIAILKCHCFYIPLENNIPMERLKYIYGDVDAQLIISDELDLGLEQYQILNVNSADMGSSNNLALSVPDIEGDDLVYVMYTSGTTGRPKGVKIKYSNLENLVISFKRILYSQFSGGINVGVLASFCFDASVKQIFCALYYGHTLVVSNDSVKNFGRKIHNFHNTYNLTVCDCTPAHIKLMTRQNGNTSSKVQYLIVGGENLRWEDLVELKKRMGSIPTIINVYGPTECCVDVAFNRIMDVESQQKGFVSIGNPLDNTELSIYDENRKLIQKKNCPGELCIKGKQVGAGYVNVKSENFISCIGQEKDYSMYMTGDLAMYNDNMEIIILSRIDRQVKLNGFRIELDEISSLISSYLGYGCAVCMVEENQVKKLVAFIAGSYSEELVKSYLSKQLPVYMIPKVYMQIKEIPLTNHGKVDAVKLDRLYSELCTL